MAHSLPIGALSFLLVLAIANAQSQTSSPITVGGVVHNQLTAPATAPTAQVVGTCTGTNYQYQYAAVDAAGGITTPSGANLAVSGCSTLNTTTTFNVVSTSTVPGASSCIVWRIAPTGNKGKVGVVPCGGAILDTSTSLDGSSPPGVNSTGSVSALGTVTAQNFLAANGTSAGTSDWVQGATLPTCSATQSQPCIQPNSFFIAANSSLPSTPFGWLSPTAPNTLNSVLIVGAQSGIASPLIFGSLTDPASTTIATTSGSFSSNHLVLANTTSGVDLTDSGIAIGTVSGPTDSLTITPGTTTTPTVTIAATGSDSIINLSHLTKSTGVHIFQPGTSGDSTQMFQLRNAGGTIFSSFDSSGKQFRIGDNQPPAAVLDVAGLFQVNSNGLPVKQGGISLAGAGFPGIVFNTVSSTGTGSITTPVTMVASPTTNPENSGGTTNATCYRISFYAFQASPAASGCTGNTNIGVQVVFTDPLASANTVTVGAFVINLNGTVNSPISPSTGGTGVTTAVGAGGGYILRAKASTQVQYATNVQGGTGCSTRPSYWIIPILEQL